MATLNSTANTSASNVLPNPTSSGDHAVDAGKGDKGKTLLAQTATDARKAVVAAKHELKTDKKVEPGHQGPKAKSKMVEAKELLDHVAYDIKKAVGKEPTAAEADPDLKKDDGILKNPATTDSSLPPTERDNTDPLLPNPTTTDHSMEPGVGDKAKTLLAHAATDVRNAVNAAKDTFSTKKDLEEGAQGPQKQTKTHVAKDLVGHAKHDVQHKVDHVAESKKAKQDQEAREKAAAEARANAGN